MRNVQLRAKRSYPAIPTITGELDSHTRALKVMAEAIAIHERRTQDFNNSFVRMHELVDMGLVTIKDGQFNKGGLTALAVDESADYVWTGEHNFQLGAVFADQVQFQSLASGGDASNPAIRFSGDADSGFFQVSTANILGVALGGIEQIRLDSGGIPVKITGTSDATQPSCRYSQYTADFATERGYWGFPTSLSDTMIMRNVVGSEIQFRTSTNSSSLTVKTQAAEITKRREYTGVISPAQLTANTNNWNPTDLATSSVIRFSTDVSRNLTGITAQPSGTRITLCNIGTTDCVLVNDATSTAANRFLCPGGANFTLNGGDSVDVWYDSTSSRWRVIEA